MQGYFIASLATRARNKCRETLRKALLGCGHDQTPSLCEYDMNSLSHRLFRLCYAQVAYVRKLFLLLSMGHQPDVSVLEPGATVRCVFYVSIISSYLSVDRARNIDIINT